MRKSTQVCTNSWCAISAEGLREGEQVGEPAGDVANFSHVIAEFYNHLQVQMGGKVPRRLVIIIIHSVPL